MKKKLSKNKFFLPENYKENLKPSYFLDKNDDKKIYQPYVYELAKFFAQRAEIKYIIDIGCGNREKLLSFPKEIKIIGIDLGENLKIFKKNIPDAQTIEVNLEKEFPQINKEILESSIIICSDVIEHLINPSLLLSKLSELSYLSSLILISTPDRKRVYSYNQFGPPENPSHVREWTLEELTLLFKKYKFNYFLNGYTINNNIDNKKSTQIFLTGKIINPNIKTKNLKVLAIMSCYDEEDIIEESILYLLKQDIDVFVIDNWSKDKTYSILLSLKKKYPHNLFLKRFPNKPAKYYQWNNILKFKQTIAKKLSYDWFIHYDADEVKISCWEKISLKKGIEIVDTLGFNAIDFTTLEMKFCYPSSKDKYFDFGRKPGHFLRISAWKKAKQINLFSSGGHEIKFPNKKVFPLKFLLFHYSSRSINQFFSKLAERISRYSPEELKGGWHTHYLNTPLREFLASKNDIKFNHHFFKEYLVERLSGVDILTELPNQKALDNKTETSQDIAILNNRIKSLVDENNYLKSSLEKIQSAKVYKIWQGYCKIRDKVLEKIGIKKNESSEN